MPTTPAQRGFLPASDPAIGFPEHWELTSLDAIGRQLPSLLEDPHFRTYARELSIPPWPVARPVNDELVPLLRLYYLRLGFLASAYVNRSAKRAACSTVRRS
jgi:indoleamine 2,3-dioxygenase